MRKNLLIVAILMVASYFVGVESAKARGKNYEDLRHQIERLWTSADAKKARHKLAKKARRTLKGATKSLAGN